MLYVNRGQEVKNTQPKGENFRYAYKQASAMCIKLEATITELETVLPTLS